MYYERPKRLPSAESRPVFDADTINDESNSSPWWLVTTTCDGSIFYGDQLLVVNAQCHNIVVIYSVFY
jgi:hypothetical protein